MGRMKGLYMIKYRNKRKKYLFIYLYIIINKIIFQVEVDTAWARRSVQAAQ